MNPILDSYDIKRLKKKLMDYQNLSKAEVLHLLDVLDKIKINNELLMASKIHVVLHQIAKGKYEKLDKEIVDKAKLIRNNWKTVLSSQPKT